jgi:hypothetical protein
VFLVLLLSQIGLAFQARNLELEIRTTIQMYKIYLGFKTFRMGNPRILDDKGIDSGGLVMK